MIGLHTRLAIDNTKNSADHDKSAAIADVLAMSTPGGGGGLTLIASGDLAGVGYLDLALDTATYDYFSLSIRGATFGSTIDGGISRNLCAVFSYDAGETFVSDTVVNFDSYSELEMVLYVNDGVPVNTGFFGHGGWPFDGIMYLSAVGAMNQDCTAEIYPGGDGAYPRLISRSISLSDQSAGMAQLSTGLLTNVVNELATVTPPGTGTPANLIRISTQANFPTLSAPMAGGKYYFYGVPL